MEDGESVIENEAGRGRVEVSGSPAILVKVSNLDKDFQVQKLIKLFFKFPFLASITSIFQPQASFLLSRFYKNFNSLNFLMYTIFSNLVFTNKYLSLWEKETKNQEEERSMQEVMAKEDPERLPSQLLLLKLKQRAENKKAEDLVFSLFQYTKLNYFPPKRFPRIFPNPPPCCCCPPPPSTLPKISLSGFPPD